MKKCPKCGAEHNLNGRFCSRSCANSRDMSKRRGIPHSPETLEKCRAKANEYWSNEENREKFSKVMKEAVLRNPDSYSKNNVSGRAKMYEVLDSCGNSTKVKGKWELKVAEYLNEKGIRWTNNMIPFAYEWKGKFHLYFPDFFLIDKNEYVEVKGYKTDRDEAKWSQVSNLIVIEKEDLRRLDGKIS
jgi:hypothetical protein